MEIKTTHTLHKYVQLEQPSEHKPRKHRPLLDRAGSGTFFHQHNLSEGRIGCLNACEGIYSYS